MPPWHMAHCRFMFRTSVPPSMPTSMHGFVAHARHVVIPSSNLRASGQCLDDGALDSKGRYTRCVTTLFFPHCSLLTNHAQPHSPPHRRCCLLCSADDCTFAACLCTIHNESPGAVNFVIYLDSLDITVSLVSLSSMKMLPNDHQPTTIADPSDYPSHHPAV